MINDDDDDDDDDDKKEDDGKYFLMLTQVCDFSCHYIVNSIREIDSRNSNILLFFSSTG